MQTTTTTTAAPAKTKEQIAREVSKKLAAAIIDGASAESLRNLHKSWHEDVQDVVEILDGFFTRAEDGSDDEMNLAIFCNDRHIAECGFGLESCWLDDWNRDMPTSCDEIDGTATRLAEFVGNPAQVRIWGKRAELPASAEEFRAIFAGWVAEAMIKANL